MSTGAAPIPVTRRGGVLLWDAREIRDWAAERLQPLLEDEARRLIRMDRESFDANQIPSLHTSHGLAIDPTLPSHISIRRVEKELRALLERINSEGNQLGEQLRAIKALTGNETSETRSGPWSRANRKHRTLQERRRRLEEESIRVRRMKDDVQQDLTACSDWISSLLNWAESARKKRLIEVIAEILERPESEARRVVFSRYRNYENSAEFVAENPKRAFRVTHPEMNLKQVRDAVSAGNRGLSDYIVLDGDDFGLYFRDDSTDDSTHVFDTNGTWRVSWIADWGHELYAIDGKSGKIVLFGNIPGDKESITEWLGFIASGWRERNSLGLLARAFDEQLRAGFPLVG